MPGLKEQEQQLRLYMKTVDEQIQGFELVRKSLQERMDEIREEITKHSFSPTPISLKPKADFEGDVYADVQRHLLELNKLKNYISIKLKEVVKEEELLQSLKGKFGESIDFEKPKRGEFEIVYTDEKVENAFDRLKNGKEKVKLIKDSLNEMEDGGKEGAE